jgi:hypothetical protein
MTRFTATNILKRLKTKQIGYWETLDIYEVTYLVLEYKKEIELTSKTYEYRRNIKK